MQNETKITMINHNSLKLPNVVPEAGTTVSSYIRKRQEAEKRRPTPEELAVNGTGSGNPSGTNSIPELRTGEAVSESYAAKPYEPGDMPPNGGEGFSDEKNGRIFQPKPTERTENERAPFEVMQAEWIELSPYGEFPHARGIQLVDRQAAEKIVAQFNSFWGQLGRRFAGVPVYIGHPDVPEFANEYPDKKAYGWITHLQARGSGLFAKVKWSSQGREMLQNAHYKFYSPFWEAVYVGEKSGKKIYRPTNLLSVGLTNQPNLPVPPLANEKRRRKVEQEGTEKTERDGADGTPKREVEKSKHLTANGADYTDLGPQAWPNHASLPPSASVQSSSHNPGQCVSHLSLPLANEVLALQTLLRQRDERIHGLHAQLENSRSEWSRLEGERQEEIGNLRGMVEALENSRIEIVLDHAMQHGRIAPAERPFWNTQLRHDFEVRHEELKNRPEAMHMQSITGNLGKAQVDMANAENRGQILRELVAAKQKLGMKYDEAWFAVKEERPDLFAMMEGSH